MWDLIGQCTAPFSPGDVTKHLHDPFQLTVYAIQKDSDYPDASPKLGGWRIMEAETWHLPEYC
jgi:hypothetical protein